MGVCVCVCVRVCLCACSRGKAGGHAAGVVEAVVHRRQSGD